MKEFEPYKELWVGAADFLKLQDSWLQNPLANIDPNSLEPQINDLIKIMTKCVKHFAEVPGDNK